jgi:predicted MPP superfamily phosphohydrolase
VIRNGGGLDIGLRGDLHVREERLSDRRDACRLLYVSDIHLRRGRSERLSGQVLDAARRSTPDAVLLGGDLVDRRSELPLLDDLVRRLADIAPVFAVGGNHDDRVGLDRVREAVVRGRGAWIHDRVARVSHGTRTISIAGPESVNSGTGSVRVLCAHNPRVWRRVRDAGFDLVLAGHLHGFQLVACEFRDRLFPGAIFYPYCFLSHDRGRTRLVVSRGVSDLLPIRWRCPREVVLCHV